jgi:acyl carrier protein
MLIGLRLEKHKFSYSLTFKDSIMLVNIRETILKALLETIEFRGSDLLDEITDESVLLATGLDSLGFAILVSRLEEDLSYDPFVLMDEPFYPKTFGEFVKVYEQFKEKAA